MATKATGAADGAGKSAGTSKVWIAVAGVVVAAGVVGGALIITNNNNSAVDEVPAGAKIGYAEGAVAIDEASALAAANKTNPGSFMTEYVNDAASLDGSTFQCYVGNSAMNTYDMYIQIFADEDMTDQIFLSELLRPGTVFEEITLEHPLDVGTHRVYVVFTQVEEDLATAAGQVAVTMDFTVIEENS